MVETECLAGFSEERSEVFLGKCASRSDGDDSTDVPMLACERTSCFRKSLDVRLIFADCSLVPPLLTSGQCVLTFRVSPRRRIFCVAKLATCSQKDRQGLLNDVGELFLDDEMNREVPEAGLANRAESSAHCSVDEKSRYHS